MNVKKELLLCLSFLFICSMFGWPSSAGAEGQLIEGSYGGRTYDLYVPDQYDSSQSYPLYVMLHGCTQDARGFATGTKMNALADEKGFLVLYPEQSSIANSNKCWNWFEPSHQSRGSGEPSIIAGMVQLVKSQYSINDDQVYVAGLSAGGAMSVIMGAAYPDVFSGVGVASGLEYKAATSMISAFTAMSSGGPNPTQQGRLAYQAMGSNAEPLPVIVFHGTSDYTVNQVNGEQVISQWAVTNSLAASGSENGWIDNVPESTENLQIPSGRSYTVKSYENSDGQVWMKKVEVSNMGHAWSGGSSAGSYTDPTGPDASLMMYEFFKSFTDEVTDPGDPGDPDPVAPDTTANPPGGIYHHSVTVELTANKPATIYYTLDGSDPTVLSMVYRGPITITENTTLKFFSRDSEGNEESVKQEVYTITAEPPTEGTVLTSIGAEDGFAGMFLADGTGTGDIKVGDKGMYNIDTYRGILSFNTSNLTEPVQSAKLRLYVKAKQGNVNAVVLDIKSGVFGTSAAIEQTDYSSAATQANAARIASLTGDYIEIVIPANFLSSINQNGLTQFRLKAETTAGFNANFIEFYGGENQEFAPQLIINDNN